MDEKLTREILLKDGIRSITAGDKHLYSVEDVRNIYPDMKINIDMLEDGYVPIEGIEPMTEFDKNILKTLRYRK